MAYENKNEKLTDAINNNNWDEIYELSAITKLHYLRLISSMLKDKMEPEYYLKTYFETVDSSQELQKRSTYEHWLDSNKGQITNEYMYSFLKAILHDGLQSKLASQIAELENLTLKFPDRWETYIYLTSSYNKRNAKTLQYLMKAQNLAPKKEYIYVWLLIISRNHLKKITEYGNEGYKLNQNNLFFFLMAWYLARLERVNTLKKAKEYYQKIIQEEPINSYLRNLSEKNKESLLSPYIIIIGYITIMICAIVGIFIAKSIVGLIIGGVFGWLLRFPIVLSIGSIQGSISRLKAIK